MGLGVLQSLRNFIDSWAAVQHAIPSNGTRVFEPLPDFSFPLCSTFFFSLRILACGPQLGPEFVFFATKLPSPCLPQSECFPGL